METIAVYWEPQIKTYGITQKTGLHLVSMTMPLIDTVSMLKKLRFDTNFDGALLMVSAGPTTDKGIRACLVFDASIDVQDQPELLNKFLKTADGGHRTEIETDVEMVYFHGPHYGDRYGIAHTVFNALVAGNVPLLTSACSGSSIYLVVSKGQAAVACQALANDVVVPKI